MTTLPFSSVFLKWPYPPDQHEGRLLFADPVAQAFDVELRAFKWITQYARELEVEVDDLIYVGITNMKPKAWPETLATNKADRVNPNFWKQLTLLTGYTGYPAYKTEFLIPKDEP